MFVLTLFIATSFQVVTADTDISTIPYKTYTIGLDGDLVQTATAYEGTFILNEDFSGPRDIFIKNDKVYIADTGNKRIFIYEPNTRTKSELTHDLIQEPTGIFVTDDNRLFIADAKSDLVLEFDANLQLLASFDRPTEPLFGALAPYEPVKVAIDNRENIYVLSESGTNGIIQMDSDGRFLGYFGINKVNVTLQFLINRALMSPEQREKFASLAPKSTTNIAVDSDGLIYTVIKNEYETSLKKLNIEGNNILTESLVVDPDYEDLTVDSDGNIYTVSLGSDVRTVIGVHDSFGNLLFRFGSQMVNSLRIGEFGGATGIAVDSQGDIWVLDGQGNNVQVFSKTEFASMVLTATKLYKIGEYDESAVLFKEIVRQNSLFALAHSRLGKAYERDEDFENALQSYEIANNKEGYSNAYWEVRDLWISDNIVVALIVIGVLLVASLVYRHTKYVEIVGMKKAQVRTKLEKYQLYREMKLFLRVFKHPVEVVYDIKFRQAFRMRTAAALYVLFVLLNILSNYYVKGYLFKSDTSELVFLYEILKWSVPLLLFGAANYLISTLQNGEALYRDLFIGVVFALAPIFVFKLPLDILSNFLTYNEAFIYNLANFLIVGWSVINLLILFKEMNNFKFGQLIVNLLLTIFVMVIMIILYLIVNILSSQLFKFIIDIVKEVTYR